MVARFSFAELLAVLSLAACGDAEGGTSSGFNGASSGGSSSGGSSGNLSSGGNGGSSSGGVSDCSEAAKLVYVVSAENDLYSFKPSELSFSKIGTLNCPAAFGATPNSMAVDRSGTAWVNFSDGTLFKVSTGSAACERTSFQAGQQGFERFGMAFSSNGAGAKDETLYVVGIQGSPGPNDGKGLARIDLTSMKLTRLGDFTGPLRARGAELTGTGDGKLFGFFTTSPANLAEIEKQTGATPTPRALNGVNTGEAWAFSFWGGDFWFYTAAAGETSKVTRMKTSSDSSISVVRANLGFRIVGAGVSTCAPLTPPK